MPMLLKSEINRYPISINWGLLSVSPSMGDLMSKKSYVII
jgi:hypothetical protein